MPHERCCLIWHHLPVPLCFISPRWKSCIHIPLKIEIPSETEPQHPTDFFTTLSVHSLVANMPMIIFVFSSFGQLGRRSLVVQLVDTEHTQQDVAVRGHLPCSG